MKRRRLLLAVLVIIAALVMLFGCGMCCVLSKHRCAPKTEPEAVVEPKHPPFSANGITHDVYEAVLLSDRVLVMSDRPGTIVADLKIPFARPRQPSLRSDPLYIELCSQILERVMQE